MNKKPPKQHRHSSIRLYLKLSAFGRPYRWHAISISILVVVSVFYDLYNVWLQKQMIEVIDQWNIARLRHLIVYLFIVFLVFSGFSTLRRIVAFDYKQKINMGMLKTVFNKINRLPIRQIREKHTSEWMTHLSRDISQAEGIVGRLSQNVIYQLTMLIVAFGYISSISLKYSLWLLVMAPLPLLAGRFFDKTIRRLSKELSRKSGEVRGVLQETLHGIQEIKMFGLEESSFKEYEAKLQELNQLSMHRSLVTSAVGQWIRLLSESIRFIVLALIVWLAIYGRLEVSAVLAFMLLISHIQGSFNSTSSLIGTAQGGLASAERLFSVLELEDEEKDRNEKKAFMREEEVRQDLAIQFSNLRFSYTEGERPLFDRLNLEIKQGEIVAIVGPSGSGKSTIARLCCGLYDYSEGDIRINGMAVREELSKIRSEIAYVPQEPFFFTGTIYENIVLDAKSVTKQDVMEAAKSANILEDILALPHGFNEQIKELGKNFSGGQKQKIALARAFLQKSNIFIFDEITSALDDQSEKMVTESILRLSTGKTAVIITHRMRSVHLAEKIFVMDKGNIIEQGTHAPFSLVTFAAKCKNG